MQLDRLAIADALRAIGALLELDGAPRFRAEAYVRGARAVEAAKHLDRLVAEGRLQELPGIGAGLAAVVTELATTGRSRALDELAARMPPGARELAPVATLPQIRRLHEALGVTTLAELEQAAASGRVRAVKGFGPATEAKLLAKVRAFRSATPALRMVAARTLAAAIATHVGETAEVASIVPVGAVRRGELVEKVEVLALSDAPARALAAFERFPQRIETTAAGADHASLRLVDGTLATLHVAAPADGARAGAHHRPGGARRPGAGALDALGAPRPASERRSIMIGRAFVPPELRDLPDALERAAGRARGPPAGRGS
ncbi:MAG: hypothetical protein U1F43_07110 [Myxococcota bacterium]